MGQCDCGRPTVWNDMCEDCNDAYDNQLFCCGEPVETKVSKDYHIEYVYKVWDNANGDNVIIQQYDDDGVFEMSPGVFTVEQIPGIIEVLQKLEKEYKASRPTRQVNGCNDPNCCDPVCNSRSGRPDPPF